MAFNKLVLLTIFVGFSVTSVASYAEIAGKTILAKGAVSASNQDGGEVRKLKRRSQIYDVDSITTGENSKAQFNMADGGLITLKENSQMLISDYTYDKNTKQGSATLELVSGGLRSISGLIKKTGGDYQVKTPIGSIGIRGTHFVVQVVDESVVFGVYSGNIDIKLDNDDEVLSLGVTENFAFASVDSLGQITTMTQAPKVLSNGFGDDKAIFSASDESTESTDSTAANSQTSESEQEAVFDSSLYNESNLQGISNDSIADLISQRSGTLTYNQVESSAINSSVGNTTDFNMSLTVDFDNGSVPGGELSFSDQQGQWFASYSGLINVDQLELGVNFASHGNNKAQGNISAAFANGLDELIGSFKLSEINDPTVNADGSFKIKP